VIMDFLPSMRQGVHPPDATRRARREPAEVASLSETGSEQEHEVRLPAFRQPGDGLRLVLKGHLEASPRMPASRRKSGPSLTA
jgi:hypothetical protein